MQWASQVVPVAVAANLGLGHLFGAGLVIVIFHCFPSFQMARGIFRRFFLKPKKMLKSKFIPCFWDKSKIGCLATLVKEFGLRVDQLEIFSLDSWSIFGVAWFRGLRPRPNARPPATGATTTGGKWVTLMLKTSIDMFCVCYLFSCFT